MERKTSAPMSTGTLRARSPAKAKATAAGCSAMTSLTFPCSLSMASGAPCVGASLKARGRHGPGREHAARHGYDPGTVSPGTHDRGGPLPGGR